MENFKFGNTFFITSEGEVKMFYKNINGIPQVFNPHINLGFESLHNYNVTNVIDINDDSFSPAFKQLMQVLLPEANKFFGNKGSLDGHSLAYNVSLLIACEMNDTAFQNDYDGEYDLDMGRFLHYLAHRDDEVGIAAKIYFELLYMQRVNYHEFNEDWVQSNKRYPEGFWRQGVEFTTKMS